jgi:small subunit ribosomal protein S5
VDRLISVNRVAKVLTGGRRFAFSALVCVGDQNGTVGIGLGKAREVAQAITKATAEAHKNLFKVPRIGSTIPHPIQARKNAGEILLKPASPGTGVIAGGPVRAVLECAGIHDILSKSLGSPNSLNIVQATVKALQSLEQIDSVAKRRNMTLKQVAPHYLVAQFEADLAAAQAKIDTENAENADPESVDAKSAGKETTDNKSVGSKSADNKPADNKTVGSATADKETATSKSTDGKTADSKTGGTVTAESKSADSKGAENKSDGSKSADNKPADKKTADTVTADKDTEDNKSVGGKVADSKSADKESAAAEPAETKTAGTATADSKSADSKTAGTATADKETADNKSADGKSANKEPADTKTVDKETATSKPGDSKGVDSKTAGTVTADTKTKSGSVKKTEAESEPKDKDVK